MARLDSLRQSGVNLLEIDLKNIDRGIKVPNLTAKHPITGQAIPIFVTSYVHADYGSGSIMGVPAHDERD